ncbi:hypothetical protein HMPREF1030_03147 [Pseudomonas aeruginosa]|nr:hypothetical protein HMPREF1030_03147 [Pseudomonas aeruginosa]
MPAEGQGARRLIGAGPIAAATPRRHAPDAARYFTAAAVRDGTSSARSSDDTWMRTV